MARVRGVAYVLDQVVAEGTLVMAIEPEPAIIHPTAVVEQGAEIGAGTTVAPNAVIGPQVRIGPRCKIGAGAIIEGATTIGEGTEVFPVRVDRPDPAGHEVPGRADAARDRKVQRLPRVRHGASRHRGRWWA